MMDRLQSVIADPRNLAGMVGALGGVGLMLGGVIADGWLPITIGLYGAGFLAAQIMHKPKAPLAVESTRPVTELPGLLRQRAAAVRPSLPLEAQAHLDAMLETLSDIEPRIAELSEDSVSLAPVRSLLGKYLPGSLEAWARVPRRLRTSQPPAGGPSPATQITAQLTLLDEQMLELARNLAAGDLNALEVQGRFLETRFQAEVL